MQLYDLYIPLCFYYIETDMEVIKSFAYFTFHYASTISKSIKDTAPVVSSLHSTMLLLYLLINLYKKTKNATLHSTMLLLYLQPKTELRSRNPLYIPLCFYYIPLLFSPSIFFNTGTLFVYLLSSLISFQKLSTFHFTKYKFPLIFQALSISQQFFAIGG